MYRYLISGVVQGVGFRYFVFRKARLLGLTGWVSNLPDGRVEVVASGDLSGLTALEEALNEGPRMARVARVDKSEISDEIERLKTFDIR
jgi:acylphosphatase